MIMNLISLALVASVFAVQLPVNLGTAGDFAILTKTGVTTTVGTSIVGDMGTSPIASTALTGFGLILHSSTTYATSPTITGKVYAASYTAPTPQKMTTAIADMETAFTDASGRVTPDFSELGAGSIQALTLTPGLYKWGTSVGFTSSVTFDGSDTDIWVLQISEDLIVGNGAIVTLTGGAKEENIFWQVEGMTSVGTSAQMKGIILCKTAIVCKTGSSLNGRALAQTAVTLDAVTIVAPVVAM
jgi:hypothetical protein